MADDNNKQLVQISAEKLIEALLHAKQFEQHYATQESVDNLKERMNEKFAEQKSEINRRFEQVDKRFDELRAELKADNRHTNSKIDRLQWFIVATALALIFKDYVFRALGV